MAKSRPNWAICRPEIAVEILTPHHLHYRHTLDAAAAGKHISLQKPKAISVAQADKMINAAEQAGVIFKVFENFIFYPPVLCAKELIAAGEIGEPLTIRIKSNAANSPNAWRIQAATQEWRFQPEKCGGGPLVFDDGHHKFSLAWYFMGMAEEVHAWIGRLEAPLGGPSGSSIRRRSSPGSSRATATARWRWSTRPR